ncbi:MAG: DUF429 domain-containing protein [Rhodospirillales bacterium]|nr:DUF429 domain-containing protein [Rhodospirillales bacterium]
MLKSTFVHLPGIGRKKERDLWADGVLNWESLLERLLLQADLFGDTNPNASPLVRSLEESIEAFDNADTEYFAARLPTAEHYRIALSFPDETLFVDIETTGLSLYYDEITLIGASKQDRYYCYTSGTDRSEILDVIGSAKCLVTFNGTIFDLKFIQKRFEALRIPNAHVDLRFFSRRAGYSGGQKKIERELGIDRSNQIVEMIGEQAPLLWHEYRMGNQNSAKKLVSYNHADVEGMKSIFDVALNRVLDKDGLPTDLVKLPRFGTHKSSVRFSKAKSKKKNSVYVPRYQRRRGPLITYGDLNEKGLLDDLRVVGIDITGSEQRPSGWAALRGDRAHTEMIHTDLELVFKTIREAPNIVSIDSPLSLPVGRISVFDDDPGRKEFGIMRWCERELKRRGVNVYPCLIPSMQRVTQRGIRLANALRAMGIPVIESYPGAAQDIMDIPRKRAGLAYLAKGLADFGVTGRFADNSVTHDELDAITSAVVGLFFWSGRFEPLGNEDEDYLIIPDLTRSNEQWLNRQAIGISGPIAAGKTTSGRYLESRGYQYGRYSQVLENELKLLKPRKKISRKSLQTFGQEVNEKKGQSWLGKKLVILLGDDDRVVIDGMRFPEDHAFMVEAYGPGFRHLHIDASESVRKKRYTKGKLSVAEFKKAITHPVERNTTTLKRIADSVVNNDGDIKALYRRIGRAIKT